MINNPRPLVLAVIEALILLESSGVDEIDPDVAVRGMENIASSLLRLSEADQRAMRTELAAIGGGSEDERYGEFVAGVADMIGLAE